MAGFARLMNWLRRLRRIGRHKAGAGLLVLLAFAPLLTMAAANGGRPALAAAARDCSDNSIDHKDLNGGCGAADPQELVADLKDNDPSDLQTIYADGRIGLPTAQYDNFAANAQMGEITRGGELKVDGQTVMTGVWTMGRTTLGGKQPTAITIGGKTYYHSPPSASFAGGVQSIPAMVLFDDQGTVQAAVLNPCGNPVTKGKKIKSSAVCKELLKTPVDGKENTFQFTTKVDLIGLAKVVKLEYFIDEGQGPQLFDTETNPSTPTPAHTFTKDATISVKVTIGVPGKKTRVIESEACKQQVTVKKPPTPTPTPTPTPKPQPQVLSATTPMPVTGPAALPGLFVGTSLAGTLAHRLYRTYRDRRRR